MKYLVTLYVGLMMFAYSALAQAIVPADVFVKSVADEVLTIIKKIKTSRMETKQRFLRWSKKKLYLTLILTMFVSWC